MKQATHRVEIQKTSEGSWYDPIIGRQFDVFASPDNGKFWEIVFSDDSPYGAGNMIHYDDCIVVQDYTAITPPSGPMGVMETQVGGDHSNSSDGPTPSRYRWQWKGVAFDFYRLCEILGVTHHAQAHALKKIIRAGKSIKSTEQDIDETISALMRWKEMINEDRNTHPLEDGGELS
jgi:hypothetical protein